MSNKRSDQSATPPGEGGASRHDPAPEQVQSAGEEVADAARDAAQKVKEAAGEYAEEGRQKGVQYAERGKKRLADDIGGVAGALRDASDRLREDSDLPISGYLDQAASGLQRFSKSVDERSIEQLFAQGRELARRQPAVFAGGAFVIGFALSRFAKASSDRSEHAYVGNSGATGAGGARAQSVPATTQGYSASADRAASTPTPTPLPVQPRLSPVTAQPAPTHRPNDNGVSR